MRVLIATYPEKTHFFLMVPIAWALRTAGHDVRVATQPKLVDTVVQTGLTAVPVGGDEDWSQSGQRVGDGQPWPVDRVAAAMTDPQDLDWSTTRDFFRDATESFFQPVNEPLFDGMVAYARQWQPDLVIWEHFTYAGAVAATVVGAAHARLICGADVLERMRRAFLKAPEQSTPEGVSDPLREWLSDVLARYDHSSDDDIALGQATIDQAPASLRFRLDGVATMPVRYLPYNGPAEIPAWLHEPPTRPRICVTAGITMRQLAGHDMLPVDMLRALADLDIEVVATLVGPKGSTPQVPENVRLVDFVPFHALLPTCSAVVHAGGAGSWYTSTHFGVPQLTLTSIWDTVARARLTQDTGAGLTLLPDQVTPEALRDNVLRLLEEPSFAKSAEQLRQGTLAAPTPNDAVRLLERLAAEGEAPDVR